MIETDHHLLDIFSEPEQVAGLPDMGRFQAEAVVGDHKSVETQGMPLELVALVSQLAHGWAHAGHDHGPHDSHTPALNHRDADHHHDAHDHATAPH